MLLREIKAKIKKHLKKSTAGTKLLKLYSTFREGSLLTPPPSPEEIRFTQDYALFMKKFRDGDTRDFLLDEKLLQPKLNEFWPSQSFDKDYIYHTAWATRKIKEFNPEKHVDISSSLYFSAILSAFLPVDLYDYRITRLELDNLYCGKADLKNLHFPDNSIQSLSCLSVIEHIGLGRYGDEIDPLGDIKAMKELQRVLSVGGRLVINVPLNKSPCICFNAHRIYSVEMILNIFSALKCEDLLIINTQSDDPQFFKSGDDPQFLNYRPGLYASGCFLFTK